MKYEAPKFEKTEIEIKDILTASSENYEIIKNDDGSGDVLMDISRLFI